MTPAGSKAAYEKILEYVSEHTGLKVSYLYIFQAKQEYGIIERGIYLAEIRKRQVALMPLSEKQKTNATVPKHFGINQLNIKGQASKMDACPFISDALC